MKTGNPVLTSDAFGGFGYATTREDSMTVQGVVNKSAILLLCLLLTAGWTWSLYYKSGDPASVMPWTWGGAIGGFIIAMVTTFKKEWAPVLAPLYAALEGLFLGGISSIMEAAYPGIVMQAVGLTFGTLAALLFIYKSGIIQVTDKFRLGVVAATGGIALVYLVSIGLSFFGIQIPGIFANGWVGIGFSVFVVILASMNLILDFDFIEQSARRAVPKYMEWFAAFALMVTLVWLYIEILRLLSKLRESR